VALIFFTGIIYATGLYDAKWMNIDPDDVLWVPIESFSVNRSNVPNTNTLYKIQESKFYGYPFCYISVVGGKVNAYATPKFMNDSIHTDEWCRQNSQLPFIPSQVINPVPVTSMAWNYGKPSFPNSYGGFFFVSSGGLSLFVNNTVTNIWNYNGFYSVAVGQCFFSKSNKN